MVLGSLGAFFSGTDDVLRGMAFRVASLDFLAAIVREWANKGFVLVFMKTAENGELALNMDLLTILGNEYLGIPNNIQDRLRR